MKNTLHKKHVSLLAVGLVGASLAACSDGGRDRVVLPPPQPRSQTIQEQLGANFAVAFDQAMTAEPIDPVDGDVIALDLTAEPLDPPNP